MRNVIKCIHLYLQAYTYKHSDNQNATLPPSCWKLLRNLCEVHDLFLLILLLLMVRENFSLLIENNFSCNHLKYSNVWFYIPNLFQVISKFTFFNKLYNLIPNREFKYIILHFNVKPLMKFQLTFKSQKCKIVLEKKKKIIKLLIIAILWFFFLKTFKLYCC